MPDYSAATVARVVDEAARVVATAGGAGVIDRAAAVVALRHAAEAAGADHIVQALRHTTALREVDLVLTAAQALRTAAPVVGPPAPTVTLTRSDLERLAAGDGALVDVAGVGPVVVVLADA